MKYFYSIGFIPILCLTLVSGCSFARFNSANILANETKIDCLSAEELGQMTAEGFGAFKRVLYNDWPIHTEQKGIDNLLAVLCWASGDVFLTSQNLFLGDFKGEKSYFSPFTGTVCYHRSESDCCMVLLHEIGHAKDRHVLCSKGFVLELRADFNVIRASRKLYQKLGQNEWWYDYGEIIWYAELGVPNHLLVKGNRYPLFDRFVSHHWDYSVSESKLPKHYDKISSYNELYMLCCKQNLKNFDHEFGAFCLILLESEFDSFENLEAFVTDCTEAKIKEHIDNILQKHTLLDCFKIAKEKRKAFFLNKTQGWIALKDPARFSDSRYSPFLENYQLNVSYIPWQFAPNLSKLTVCLTFFLLQYHENDRSAFKQRTGCYP